MNAYYQDSARVLEAAGSNWAEHGQCVAVETATARETVRWTKFCGTPGSDVDNLVPLCSGTTVFFGTERGIALEFPTCMKLGRQVPENKSSMTSHVRLSSEVATDVSSIFLQQRWFVTIVLVRIDVLRYHGTVLKNSLRLLSFSVAAKVAELSTASVCMNNVACFPANVDFRRTEDERRI